MKDFLFERIPVGLVQSRKFLSIILAGMTSFTMLSCKTSGSARSGLLDDQSSNVQSNDFRELDKKPPHLSNGRIDVLHYDVGLKFKSMDSQDIPATAKIKLVLLQPDQTVKLHMETDTLDIQSIRGSIAGKQSDLKFSTMKGLEGDKGLSGSVLKIDLPSKMATGSELTLAIDYTIKKPGKGATKGLMHRVDYEGAPIFATRNWPYYGRYWLPSNDHPADTATFHFTVLVPPATVAAANGVLVRGDYKNGSGVGSEGLRVFEWDLPTPIPLYGVSVVVGDLDIVQDEVCFDPSHRLQLDRVACDQAPVKVPYVYYIQKNHDEKTKYLKQAQEGIKQMILMSSILGSYPYQKLGFVTAPQAFNMEGVTMIMMISPEATTHEVAHHWWGNTVYIEHWGDLWISEGFTSYFTGFYNEIAKGKYEECSSKDGVLNNSSDTDPLKIFNDTPYCKGAAAVADLRQAIEKAGAGVGLSNQKGRDAFLGLMAELYQNYKFKRLGSKALVLFLKKNLGTSLGKQGIKLSPESAQNLVDSWANRWLDVTW